MALIAHTKKRRDFWRLGLYLVLSLVLFSFFSELSFFSGTWRIGHHIYPCEKALRRWHPIFLLLWFVSRF